MTTLTERATDPPTKPLAERTLGMVPMCDGCMWVAPEFLACLEHASLASFEQIMNSQSGTLLRTLPDRENWRLELSHGGAQQVMYLKRHRERPRLSRLWPRLARAQHSAGRTEAINVGLLARHGVASMTLVAYGDRLVHGVCESFVLTAELAEFTQLDHFLRRRFPAAADEPRRDCALAGLIEAVAEVARRFHAVGLNHRDFYACHFFIREPRREHFDVHLIDLQRVERRRRFRRRWVVKDLAQLAYSAPRERITATRRLAFMRRYLGVRRLRPADKRLIRQVVAKWRAMERRLGAHP